MKMALQEEETKSWKKLINIAVSGAAGMISNHLLFKVGDSLTLIAAKHLSNIKTTSNYWFVFMQNEFDGVICSFFLVPFLQNLLFSCIR